MTLKDRIDALIIASGSLRAAARSVDIDAAYLLRLSNGESTNPSDEALEKLGLVKVVQYLPAHPQPAEPVRELTDDEIYQHWEHSPAGLSGYQMVVRLGRSAISADRALRVPDDYKAKYLELIMQVGNKYPGETRHETALKYIRAGRGIKSQRLRSSIGG